MEMALRTSDLLLPEGFVEMDCEEMMYVDGGGIARSTFALCLDITIVAISFVLLLEQL